MSSSSISIKFDHLPRLTGQSNYVLWAGAWRLAFKSVHWWEVIDGTTKKPTGEPTDPKEEKTPKNSLSTWIDVDDQSHAGIANTVEEHLLSSVIAASSAAAAWQTFKDRFDRDTANTTITQLQALLSLVLTNRDDLSSHLTEFHNRWMRLDMRCAATKDNKLAKALHTVTQSDEAKAAFLLCSLPSSMENVIDNLQTKTNLTYSEVFGRLLDLGAGKSTDGDDKAYRSFAGPNGNGKECTWCKSKKDTYQGHLYSECRKLKAHQKKKKEKKEKEAATAKQTSEVTEATAFKTSEVTEATAFMASTNQTSKTWIFDTAASSHMTSDKNTMTDIREHGGFVRVANSQRMKVTGIGKVHLQCCLQDGSTQPATLEDVLLVPDLDSHGLFSWEAISRKGFKMIGYGKNIELETKEGRKVLWAKMEDKDPVIQLVNRDSEDKARATTAQLVSYTQWHEALGHTSKINADLYADGHLLPKTPNDFHCTACYLSKNVKHVPPTTENRSKECFELIHSDLSGKFSVPSLGKSLYYMTFIDDKSRFAWVYLLKNKSDAAKAIKDFVRKSER
jgi:hypothetical protein